MIDEKIKSLLDDILLEQQISPFLEQQIIVNFINDGIYDIEKNVGFKIDFSKDLKARSLLKNYVMYANHKRLAEFKELYRSEYIDLQREYYINSQSN